MAAHLEAKDRSPVGAGLCGTAQVVDPASVTAGLAYVNRCLQGHRPFGIITGAAAPMEALIARVMVSCEAREDLHAVRVARATDSVQTFIATCLAQLGFELFQAGLDDLHNLLVVFLRHESARGRRTVVLIEATDHYGPRVLEFMQTLSKVRAGATPAMTFLLTGSPNLHRILESPGMAGLREFTQERFDMDRSITWIASTVRSNALPQAWSRDSRVRRLLPLPTDEHVRRVVVMLDGAIIERRALLPGKLLIGRSPGCGLCLDSRYVSRHHAALIVGPEGVTVVDLRSTNATLVNGTTAVSQLLEHGDLLAIGNFRIRYEARPAWPLVRES